MSSPVWELEMWCHRAQSAASAREERTLWDTLLEARDGVAWTSAVTLRVEAAMRGWRDASREVTLEEWRAMHPTMRSLTRALDARDCALTDADLSALARDPELRHLTELDLADNDLTGEGLAALLHGDHRWPGLACLDLSQNPLAAAPLLDLARSPRAGLEVLRVNRLYEALPDAVLRALVQAPLAAGLRVLELSWMCPTLSEGCLIELFSASCWVSLEVLRVRAAQMGPRAWEALLRAPALSRLEHLDVSDNLHPSDPDDAVCQALIDARERLPALRQVVLFPHRIWGAAGTVDIAHHRAPSRDG